VGNAVIFGHVNGWGGPFGALPKVKVGETFVAQAHLGVPNSYRVDAVHRVAAGDPRFLGRSNDVRITLITGAGRGHWLVVTAVAGEPETLSPARDGGASASLRAPILDLSLGWLLTLGAVLVLLGSATSDLGWRVRAVVLAPPAALALLMALLRFDGLLGALR
jgi:hypothetical protein